MTFENSCIDDLRLSTVVQPTVESGTLGNLDPPFHPADAYTLRGASRGAAALI
jgi:hypothetical protein